MVAQAKAIDAGRLERDLFFRLVASSWLSVALLGIAWFTRPSLWGANSTTTLVVGTFVGVGMYSAAGITVGWFVNRAVFRPTKLWLESGAPSGSEAAKRVWRLPYIYAGWASGFWLISLLVAPLLAGNVWFDPGKLPLVKLEISLLLAGFLAYWFAYLLVETRLRAVFALATDVEGPDVSKGSSLAVRFGFLWIAGACAPLLSISVIQVGLNPANAHAARWTIWALSLAAIIWGGWFTYVAARRIVRDVRVVQRSMVRIADGDLDAKVDVESPSELGHLQAGFNRMVEGLRERRTLEDLFGRHVGTEVARLALAQGTELQGEERAVSVLFVDIIGSSRLAQSVPPTEVVELLNQFFSIVVRVLAENGGWVNKFEGDGALGIFGAPADQPDHAARALKAGREMRSELDALERANPQLRAAIGVSSGVAVAGNVGAAERYEYAVIGDPVNEASRVTDEAKTREHKLLSTSATVEQGLEESARWQSAGEVELRGREGTTKLFALSP